MSWSSNTPNGGLSVGENTPAMNGNTAYIESVMGIRTVAQNTNTTPNTDQDHFWANTGFEGRHRFMQMPGYTESGDPVAPNFASNMNAIFFCKLKDKKSAAPQNFEPYVTTGIQGTSRFNMQLGMRVMASFGVDTSNVNNSPLYFYTHNVANFNANPTLTGIRRLGVGLYQIFFANALPSLYYIVLGNCMGGTNPNPQNINVYVTPGATPANSMTTTSVLISFITNSGNLADPLVAMITIVGG